ncbi:hypothetical protein Bca101_009133 [Brassica carinata]
MQQWRHVEEKSNRFCQSVLGTPSISLTRSSQHLDPEECAWAYEMNILDLRTWRKTNFRETYHSCLKANLKSKLTV